jgi:MFS family permease
VATQFWVNGVVYASFLPRLPEIRGDIDVGTSRLGLLLGLGIIGGLAGSALCGTIMERAGVRNTMVGSALAMAAALAALGQAIGPLTFLAVLITLQFFDVCADVSMNTAGSRLSARRPVPFMNRLHGLWSIGTLVGGLAATIVANAVALSTHLVGVAVVLAAAVVYIRRGLPDDRSETTSPTRRSTGGEGSLGLTGADRAWITTSSLLFGLMGVLAFVIEDVPAQWSAIRMTDDLGASPRLAGSAFVAVTSGMVIGRLFGDHATSLLGARRLTRMAIIVSASGTATATLTPWWVVSMLGFFAAGLGAAVLFPRLYDEAARASSRPGALLGAMSAGIRVAGLASPTIVGALAATATLTVGGAMALVVVTAAVLAVVVRERVTAVSAGRGAGPAPSIT